MLLAKSDHPCHGDQIIYLKKIEGQVRGIQKRGKLVSIRHLIPAVFVITLIGTVILGYFIELP